MHKTVIVAALGCALIASSASAADRVRWTTATEHVRAADLDLNTPAGANEMFQRIKGAAGDACYQPRSQLYAWVFKEIARCRVETIARTVRALNAPLVTTTYMASSDAPRQDLAVR